MMTMAQFLDQHPITLHSTYVDQVEDPFGTGDRRWMDRWRVTLKWGRNSMTLPYYMGTGHKGAAPGLDLVMDALATDARAVQWDPDAGKPGLDPQQFAEDMGMEYEFFDEETGRMRVNPQVKKTYAAIVKNTKALARLMTPSTFKALMYDVEAL